MTDETLMTAVQYHRAGQFEAAEKIYRQVLKADPGQADALHLLGVLAYQRGDDERAVEYIERAIRSDEHQASFHSDLARALYRQGRFAEAILGRALHSFFRRPEQIVCVADPRYAATRSEAQLLLNRLEKDGHAVTALAEQKQITQQLYSIYFVIHVRTKEGARAAYTGEKESL